MTGSIALDVFIGLIFIYLLYSLLATVLLEIISTNLNIRAANLKRAVYRMLNDDKEDVKPRVRLWWAIASLIGKGFSQKNEGLAKEVFNFNGIRYLGSRGLFKSSPSNISASQFSKAILGAFADANGRTNAEGIQNYLSNKGDQESSSSGKEYLKFLFGQAQGDIDRFTAKIEEWYEEMMLVATEWYKKRMQIWLLIIGFTLACVFNLNTLYMVKVLAKDDKARNQLVQMATTYMENRESLKDLDSLTKVELDAYYKELKEQSNNATQVLGLDKLPETVKIKKDSLSHKDFLKQKNKITSFKRKKDGTYIVFEQPKEMPHKNLADYIDYKEEHNYRADAQLKLSKIKLFFDYQLWGYLLTALAISLGAPFWFDLLNKLMQLRGAVSQKKTTNGGSSAQKNHQPQDDTKG